MEIANIGIRLNTKKIKSNEKTEIKIIPLFNLDFLILSSFVFVGYTAKVPPKILKIVYLGTFKKQDILNYIQII